jgi:hypothetical protein
MDLTPGKTLTLELTARPRAAAARKTLTRIFCRDSDAIRRLRRQKRARPSWQTWRRGGRTWHHQMKSKPPVELAIGARSSVLATLDVIRDLQSVEKYVRVSMS